MTEKIQKKFQDENKNSDFLLNAIKRACEGLIYISETDSPVLPFAGFPSSSVLGKDILYHTRGDNKDQVEEIAFDEFFRRLTDVKNWFGPTEIERAKKFLDLQKLIEENLSDRKIFRIGSIRIDIYAVGINQTGQVMGVTTKAVET